MARNRLPPKGYLTSLETPKLAELDKNVSFKQGIQAKSHLPASNLARL